jgi:polyisoprenyl-phosphate glycosyltransferase
LSDRLPRLWLVSPMYFDVESYQLLRTRALEVLATYIGSHFHRVQFVVVDDSAGIDPETRELAHDDGVRMVVAPFNLGHQRAIVFGLRSIASDVEESDYIVTLDSDGQDRPQDLPAMLRPLLERTEDVHKVVIARRTKRKESPSFKVMYVAFTLLFRLLTGLVVRSGNYAAFRGWFVQHDLNHPNFDLCYSSSLLTVNPRVLEEVPCERGERLAGRSRMDPTRLIMHGIRMLMPFMDRIATRALIVFSAAFGAGVTLAGIILGIKLFSTLAIPGWASVMLLTIVTLSFVALGNFVVLFAVFSQSRGITLAQLEQSDRGIE